MNEQVLIIKKKPNEQCMETVVDTLRYWCPRGGRRRRGIKLPLSCPVITSISIMNSTSANTPPVAGLSGCNPPGSAGQRGRCRRDLAQGLRVPRARRPRPSTNYINSLYARLLSPALARVPNDSFDTPHVHFTFLLSSFFYPGLIWNALHFVYRHWCGATSTRVRCSGGILGAAVVAGNLFISFRRRSAARNGTRP